MHLTQNREFEPMYVAVPTNQTMMLLLVIIIGLILGCLETPADTFVIVDHFQKMQAFLLHLLPLQQGQQQYADNPNMVTAAIRMVARSRTS